MSARPDERPRSASWAGGKAAGSDKQGPQAPEAQLSCPLQHPISAARNVELNEGASVEELVTRLQAIGATARDVVSILQAIKAAGALEAELEVI